MVLESEVNIIGTTWRKIFKIFSKFRKISCSAKQIRNILKDNIEINNQKDIDKELYLYYKSLFNERQHLSEHDRNSFLTSL